MAAASCLLTEDQFLCSICLDVFTDPVSIPCGHNFCKSCITTRWNNNVQRQCPLCNTHYNRRLKLQVNTFISEMAAQFTQSAQHKTSSLEQHVAKPGEVPCDVCTAPKLKALKSCLVCLASYCETHLEPHLTASSLKKHQLINPVKNLEDRMCKKHDKLLELFCETDQMCVCVMCTIADHKTHDVVALEEHRRGKKMKMGKAEAEIQQMIQKRRLKIEEVKRSMELSNKAADRETAEGVEVFTALKEAVERSQAELINTITEKKRATEKQAEDLITELEQEISDLKKRSSEVKQLSQSEDQLHRLQTFKRLFHHRDWTEVRVRPPSYEGTVVRAVKQLEETLRTQMKWLFEAELQRVQQFAVHVLLNPVILISYLFPDYRCKCAFSIKSFDSGRFYFEVYVKQSSSWTLGVARMSNIEGRIMLSPQNNYWTVCAKQPGELYAATDPPVRLSVASQLGMVGVFVDYEEGLVSFYDVDAAALIYCFTGCSFGGSIHSFYSSCPNSGVRGSWWRWWHELCLH